MRISEIIYNIIEALLISGFLLTYYERKSQYGKAQCIFLSFLSVITVNTIATICPLSWFVNLIMIAGVSFGISMTFYKGNLLEKILISIVVGSLILLINISSFTIMCSLFNKEYKDLMVENDTMRFWTVMVTKVLFVIAVSFIISIKKRKLLMMNKAEYIMISVTLLISGLLISIVRNIIYKSGQDYSAFSVIIFCLLLLITVQYYLMLYVGKKNIAEKKLSIVKEQLKMQEENIRILEKSYYETSKLRHDLNNYIICANEMADRSQFDELKIYLKNLSQKESGSIHYYVHMNRKAIGAVINTKFSTAKLNGISTKCVLLDEMENIVDIDAAILLANLLDNAIEACKKNLSASNIELKIWSDVGYYCIKITNTVETDILAINPKMITSKKDKNFHGIGLQTVQEIVKKYDGILSFVQEENKFHVCISLSCNLN